MSVRAFVQVPKLNMHAPIHIFVNTQASGGTSYETGEPDKNEAVQNTQGSFNCLVFI